MKIIIKSFSLKCLIGSLFILAANGCYPAALRQFFAPPFDNREIEALLRDFQEQESRVKTFFSSGTMTFEGRGDVSELHSLIIGERTDFRIKIELTHTWGQPLIHMLIDEESVQIISFNEKFYYKGPIEDLLNIGMFPGNDLELSQLWAFLRGFPALKSYHKAYSSTGNRISLLSSDERKIQIIHFYPGEDVPSLVKFPGTWTEMTFSDFARNDGVKYAKIIRAVDMREETAIRLKLKDITFNEPLPASIFDMQIPAGFQLRRSLP